MNTAPEPELMRWVVAVDLRAHSHGAINFAVWLHAHDQTGAAAFEALHLVEARLLDLADAPARAVVLGSAKQATIAALHARKAVDAFAHIDAIETDDVVDTLAGAGALASTTGLILGRTAPDTDDGLVRLGKVARRLLRRLESPVFVVPPDLERAHIGDGPIVCAVELDSRGAELARFGQRFGAAIGRPIQLVHAVEAGDPVGLEYLPEGAWLDARVHARHVNEDAVERWCREHGLVASTSVVQGPTVNSLIRAARQLDACMILCGSRRLSLTQRLWSSSVGSALAAAAHLPVGVIPD